MLFLVEYLLVMITWMQTADAGAWLLAPSVFFSLRTSDREWHTWITRTDVGRFWCVFRGLFLAFIVSSSNISIVEQVNIPSNSSVCFITQQFRPPAAAAECGDRGISQTRCLEAATIASSRQPIKHHKFWSGWLTTARLTALHGHRAGHKASRWSHKWAALNAGFWLRWAPRESTRASGSWTYRCDASCSIVYGWGSAAVCAVTGSTEKMT